MLHNTACFKLTRRKTGVIQTVVKCVLTSDHKVIPWLNICYLSSINIGVCTIDKTLWLKHLLEFSGRSIFLTGYIPLRLDASARPQKNVRAKVTKTLMR